jgi:uncharacterized protein YkwD
VRHHFLPHPEYGYRATYISYFAIFSYLVFVFALNFSFKKVSYYYPSILGYASNINTYDLLTETNNKRKSNNLSPLSLNESLSKAAYKKAQDMFDNNYWSHVSPKGVTPWSFILNSGYDYQYAGENLARDFKYSTAVVDAWMNSPSHRDNLLNSKYSDIGFATVNGVLDGEETTLVVQMFGSLRNPAPPVPDAVKKPEISQFAVFEKSAFLGSQDSANLHPKFDKTALGKTISLSLSSFMLGLFVLDVWYIRKNKIHRLSGNTIAHVLLLMVAIAGILYAGGGVVL